MIVALFFIVACQAGVMADTSYTAMLSCYVDRFDWSDVNTDVVCAAAKMSVYYVEMRNANCKHCDKYFHCQGNYEAVYSCGNSDKARRAAEIISDCREFSQGGMDADSRADDVANRYGRNGGDCAEKYLCDVNCKYNPDDGSCLSSNC